jgi:hypothetical protein
LDICGNIEELTEAKLDLSKTFLTEAVLKEILGGRYPLSTSSFLIFSLSIVYIYVLTYFKYA